MEPLKDNPALAQGDTGQPASIQVLNAAFKDWYDDWVNLFIINLMMFMAWFTVILGPPATFGMCAITNQLAHSHSQGPREMIRISRRYFWKSWLWMLLNLLVVALVLINYFFYQRLEASWSVLPQAAFFVLGMLWLAIQFFAIPYLMEQETKSLKMALRNGLFTILGAFPFSIVVLGAVALIMGLSMVFILPIVLAVPCLLACIGNRAVIDRLRTYNVRDRDIARQNQAE